MCGKKSKSFTGVIILWILLQKDVTMTHVPQIEGLRVHQILENARYFLLIDDYMPELNDEKLPNWEFGINIGKTGLIEI